MPLVSIILPVYNVANYLEDTLDCLVGQTLKDIEIIAVNDGSTDNSEQILIRYQEQYPNIIYYYNQTNKGQSAARNYALRYACGRYVFFMDSDDRIKSDAIQQCFDYIEQTAADFIFFDGDILQEEKTIKRSWNYKRTYLVEENTRYTGEQLLSLMLNKMKHNCVVWLLFIRKDYLDRIGLRFYEGIIHEDELFTTILTLESSNVYCLQKTLVEHRVRNDSTMGRSYTNRNVNCYLTVADELLKYSKAPIIQQFLRYTLSKVFYTAHLIPFNQKLAVFRRAVKSGYLKYIGFNTFLVFWLKPR